MHLGFLSASMRYRLRIVPLYCSLVSQLRGVFDGFERDNRDRLQPADLKRPDIRRRLLSKG